MTPELLRDVEALCDAVIKNHIYYDADEGYNRCVFCGVIKGTKSGDHQTAGNHSLPDCPVLLARRIREEMKADG